MEEMQYYSMTGFGKAAVNFKNKKINVEIKSLNSKQVDIFAKLPPFYKEKEIQLRNLISKTLIRGKIDLSVTVENNQEEASNQINEAVYENYFLQIDRLHKKIGKQLSNDSIFQAIMRMPDIFTQKQDEIEQAEWNALFEAATKACEKLIEFRKQEGKALQNDILSRVKSIETLNERIAEFEHERIEALKSRISSNLKDFFDTDKLDKNRFEQELIYYLEKLDVTEEKVRLSNHCEYFFKISKNNKPVGKNLNFVIQEMGREINTLGSKANHAEMQKIVVQMKDELEKIKEQLMNVL